MPDKQEWGTELVQSLFRFGGVSLCCLVCTSCMRSDAQLESVLGSDTRWQRNTDNRASPSLETELANHSLFGLVVAVSPDSTRLAYSDLNVSGGKCPIQIADRALASYLDGPDQPIIYWDLKNSRELKRFGIPGNPWFADKQLHVAACDISDDGSTALLGTVFGTVLWWNLKEWAEITHSQMHMEELGFVFFEDDDQFAVSIGCDRDTVRENARIRHWRLVRPAVDEEALEEAFQEDTEPEDQPDS